MPSQRFQQARFARRATMLCAVAASTLLLSSCSGESSAALDGATVIDVSLGRFVIEPEMLQAPAGSIVLKVTNDDPDLVHDLVAYGKGTRRLDPGESQTLEIPDVAAGQYRIWCDVPGHAAAGQVAALVVTPAVQGSTVAP